MFRRLIIAAAAMVLVAGCKGKSTKTEDAGGVDSAPMAPSVPAENVDSAPMSFDAAGSDSGRIDGLVTVHFDYDKSNLSSDARSKIKNNADWMKKNANAKLQIEGHCDARGSIEYNIALGERRANAVRSYMTSLGISGDRLSTISYGKEKPLVQGDDESAYSKNRRANFVPVQ